MQFWAAVDSAEELLIASMFKMMAQVTLSRTDRDGATLNKARFRGAGPARRQLLEPGRGLQGIHGRDALLSWETTAAGRSGFVTSNCSVRSRRPAAAKSQCKLSLLVMSELLLSSRIQRPYGTTLECQNIVSV